MAWRYRLQFILGLGEYRRHELAEGDVESARVAAAGFRKDETAAVDVVAQFFRVWQQVRRLAAADVEDRRLEQVFDCGVGRVHHLPGEAEAPGFLGVLGEMSSVAAMLV